MGNEAVTGNMPENGKKRSVLVDALHILVLCNFAFAQPILDLLGRNAEFFLARQSEPLDIFFLVAVLCFLLALLIVLFEWAIRLVSEPAYNILHLLLLVILAATVFLPVFSRLMQLPGLVAIFGSLALAMLFAAAVVRFSIAQTFLAFLSPAALIFPFLFLFQSPVYQVVFPEEQALVAAPVVNSSAPVILLVFDEFAIASLMTEDYTIDAGRFPNFAALSKEASWFRNATAVSDDTVKGAVPAILTGNYPDEALAAATGAHDENLFTMLRGSYQMEVNETYTQLCPKILCPRSQVFSERIDSLFSDLSLVYLHLILPEEITTRLPQISHDWKQFWPGTPEEMRQRTLDQLGMSGRPDLFQRFLDSISSDDGPTLYFQHLLLPHIPWAFLPSGEEYSDRVGYFGVPGLNAAELWSDDVWAVSQGHQRYLLQLGYVDRLIGDLVARLKAEGMYDSSLIIITADHGISFRPQGSRRQISNDNIAEIAHVPLFIKRPGQSAGTPSDRNVETIDILPTIADVLGVALAQETDGISVFDTQPLVRENKTIYLQNRRQDDERLQIPDRGVAALQDIIKDRIGTFGSGQPLDDLLVVGPFENLIGEKLEDLEILEQSSNVTRARLALEPHFVNKGDAFTLDSILPFSGGLYYESTALDRPVIAVTVDGVVAATTYPFFVNAQQAEFSAFIPGKFLLAGAKGFAVYIVTGTLENPTLQKLESY